MFVYGEVLSTSRKTQSKTPSKDPQTLGAIVQNLVGREIWRPGLVYAWREK